MLHSSLETIETVPETAEDSDDIFQFSGDDVDFELTFENGKRFELMIIALLMFNAFAYSTSSVDHF